MNPVGKVPVMTAGDMTMFESGAMVQHVLDRHGDGRLEPARGTREHALYLQWSWFAEATFTRPLGEIVNHRREFGDRAIPEVIEEMEARARMCLDAVDREMRGKDYLVGDFTAADIMMRVRLALLPASAAGRFAAGGRRRLLGASHRTRCIPGGNRRGERVAARVFVTGRRARSVERRLEHCLPLASPGFA